MAKIQLKGIQNQAISRQTEGQDVFLRALRDGSVIKSDWMQAAIMGGYGYMVSDGAIVTGQTGGGQGTTMDISEPEVAIGIPNGYCIMPIRIQVGIEPGAYNAENDETEILIAADQDTILSNLGNTTADTLSVFNMNTRCGLTSACSAFGGYSTSLTDPTLDLELAHWASTADTDGAPATIVTHMCNLLYEPEHPIILNGPAALFVYFGGTVATTGYTSIQWLEFPESVFKI